MATQCFDCTITDTKKNHVAGWTKSTLKDSFYWKKPHSVQRCTEQTTRSVHGGKDRTAQCDPHRITYNLGCMCLLKKILGNPGLSIKWINKQAQRERTQVGSHKYECEQKKSIKINETPCKRTRDIRDSASQVFEFEDIDEKERTGKKGSKGIRENKTHAKGSNRLKGSKAATKPKVITHQSEI